MIPQISWFIFKIINEERKVRGERRNWETRKVEREREIEDGKWGKERVGGRKKRWKRDIKTRSSRERRGKREFGRVER
jgi:hypothetical protein